MVPFLISKGDINSFLNSLNYEWNDVVYERSTGKARRLKPSDLSSTEADLWIVANYKYVDEYQNINTERRIIKINYDAISFNITAYDNDEGEFKEKDVSNLWHIHLIETYGVRYAGYGEEYAEVRLREIAEGRLYQSLTSAERKNIKNGSDKLDEVLRTHFDELSNEDKTMIRILGDLKFKARQKLNSTKSATRLY